LTAFKPLIIPVETKLNLGPVSLKSVIFVTVKIENNARLPALAGFK